MSKTKTAIVIVMAFIGVTFLGCVDAKSQWKNDIQNKVGVVGEKLEKIVEQTADAKVVAKKIDQLTQTVKNQVAENIDLMHKTIQAGTIHYGGAGWAVASAGLMVVLFLGMGALTVYLLFRKVTSLKSMLHLVTDAVQGAPAEVQDAVKNRIEERVADNATIFTEANKRALAKFTKKVGTFALGAITDEKK